MVVLWLNIYWWNLYFKCDVVMKVVKFYTENYFIFHESQICECMPTEHEEFGTRNNFLLSAHSLPVSSALVTVTHFFSKSPELLQRLTGKSQNNTFKQSITSVK